MKTKQRQNHGSSKLRRGVMGALIAAPLTGAMLTGATAQREDKQPRALATEFPFASLARSQDVHLNASNTANPVDTANPPDDSPAPNCRVLFRLFDSEGRVVATATHNLQPGKTAQLVANPPGDEPSPTTDPPGVRGLRGEISVPAGKCSEAVLGSMEIIDTASGEVRAVIAPTNTLRVPQNNPTDTTPPRD